MQFYDPDAFSELAKSGVKMSFLSRYVLQQTCKILVLKLESHAKFFFLLIKKRLAYEMCHFLGPL